jgi:hypothetical protein
MAASPFCQKNSVYLPDEPKGEGKAASHPFKTMVQGGHIVRNLLDIVQRNARDLGILVEQKVGERRLRSLNLRGKHCFLANIRVEEELEIGESGGHPVQSPNCLVRLGKDGLQRGQIKRSRIGGQRWRNECPYFLSRECCSHIMAPCGGLAVWRHVFIRSFFIKA